MNRSWTRTRRIGRGLAFLLALLILAAPGRAAVLEVGLTLADAEAGRSVSLLDLPSVAAQLADDPQPRAAAASVPPRWGTPAPRAPSGPAPDKLDPLLRRVLAGEADLSRFATVLSLYAPQGPVAQVHHARELGRLSPEGDAPASLRARGADRLGVLITLDGSTAPLRALGVELGESSGGVVSARVTPAQLARLSALPAVAYVEASVPLEPALDRSVPDARGDQLHGAAPAARGAGVFLGVVDTGIDWTHPDFRADENGDGVEETARIAYLWDQTEEGRFGDRAAVPYGTEYTRRDIETDVLLGAGFDRGLVRQRDADGHGTHVSGILGGDGSASDAGYVGMAPEATLGMVKTTFSSGDIVDAVSYLFERADALGMPAVVNLSLGGHFGPHDGTSGFERALDELVGPGRLVVNSAGNEGNDPVHISGDLSRTGEYTVDFTALAETAVFNVWYEGEGDVSLELTSPGFGNEVETFRAGRGELLETRWDGRAITIDNASEGPYPFNGDNQIAVVLEGVEEESVWTVTLRHGGGPGRFDGWVALSGLGTFSRSDARSTISEPGNARHLITVGAYTTRARWDSIMGRAFGFVGGSPEGQIAPFSSRGPTRDGRQKPDVAAPGTAIVSALAAGSDLGTIPQLVVPDGAHAALQGTSMAAPHVAGAIALMLQADPGLTPRGALARLRGTAAGDDFTGLLPNEAWGFGKLDILRGVDTLALPLPSADDPLGLKVGLNVATRRAFFYYVLPQGVEAAEVTIFDARGELVRALELDPGATRAEWNLLSDDGAPLANGLYLSVLSADGRRSEVQPLVIRNE